MAKISLKSIAKELGVSTATISLVLNGKDKNGRVSKELSQKILDKAKELNYLPNSLAKSLREGNSRTLGLIIADITNVFFGALALYIQENAEKMGYTVIIGNTNEDLGKMQNLVNLLRRRQVDGFVITPTEGSEKIIQSILDDDMPLVMVDRYFPGLQVSSVTINNFQISYEAVNSLIAKGCHKIGMIIYSTEKQAHMQDRKDGYLKAVKEGNIYDADLIQEVHYEDIENEIAIAVTRLLSQNIDGAFFATNSISMIGLKNIIAKIKLDEKAIHFMCFDENEAYCLLPFNISFVRQPIKKMAEESIKQIIDQIENNNTKVTNSIIEAELKIL
ncbi:MAG: LacI family DNA-binding transcriptional regulator [Paludibacteraceae bacterium]